MPRKLVSSGSYLETEIGFSRAEIIGHAISEAGGTMQQVIRTRIMLMDILKWRDARAHGEFFREVRPACTFVQVSGFIDLAWLVEVEADCLLE